jgi:beta-ureidopropionase / N-carbamoyl-L-amino-acid hydrolase
MPTCDPARVLRDLKHLRSIGAYETGVHKPALSPEHVASIDYVRAELDKIGHRTVIDGIGNLLGYAPGSGRRLLAGSHLESQNHAGWLDGPLGVIYALEAARAVAADPALAGSGVDVAAWCDEEGHFGSFLGSRSAIGEVSEAEIDAARDRTTGTPMRDALKVAGYGGRSREVLDAKRYVGFFEAHIEQGDWLISHDLKIGVVTAIVGITQYRLTFAGQQNHAGTTRMAIRRDAGLAAAKLAVAIDDVFPKQCADRTVWTVGNIAFDPGAPSIIPGSAVMLFQIRDTDSAVHMRLDAELRRLVAEANARGPCKVDVEVLRQTTPAAMSEDFQSAIEAAAQTRAPGKHVRIPSGAGHDAQILAGHMPSAMMFVPSIGGISHHWTENTSDADIALGAEVYVDAAARMLRSAK